MRISLLILLLLTALHAGAGNRVAVSKTENTLVLDTSSANTCAPTEIEHYFRQSIHKLSTDATPRYALISQEFELGRGCFEGYDPANVTVTARPIDVTSGRIGNNDIWTFTTKGASGEALGATLWGIYRVEMPGCCGASTTARYFSLATGKLLASSTGQLQEVAFGDLEESGSLANRFIAVEDNTASLKLGKAQSMATVYFASRQSMKEAVTVSEAGTIGTEEWMVSAIGFKDKKLYPHHLDTSKSNSTPLHIVLKCRCDAKPIDIVIPFTADGLNVKGAIISGQNGITLTKETF